jgi:putative ABC transport system permease protein
MRIQWLLASRYLRGRLQRSFLTTLAIALAVAVLFGMNSLIPPVMASFQHSMYTSAGVVDMTISSATNGTFDESALGTVQSTEGVQNASAFLTRNVLLPTSLGGSSALGGTSSFNLTGMDPENAQSTHYYSMLQGRFLEKADKNTAVISQTLAANLGLAVGDQITVPAASGKESLEIVGILNLVSVDAMSTVYVPLATAQEILGLPGQVNSIDVILAPNTEKQAVSDALLQKLGNTFKVGEVETGTQMYTALQLANGIMWFFGFAAMLMSSFIIFNTFRTLVAERRRDLAMLRAIGANRRTLMGMITMESLLQGAIGTLAGLVLGELMAIGLLRAMSGLMKTYIRIDVGGPIFSPGILAASILLGIGFTVLSAYFPARSAMSVTPLEALRPSMGGAEKRRAVIRSWIGLGLIVLGVLALLPNNINLTSIGLLVFLVGLIMITPALVRPVAVIFSKLFGLIYPRENLLARENISRQPGRAAITASSMMIGLAITIAVLGMVTSIWSGFMGYLDKSLGSDYLFMPSSLVLGNGNMGADPSLAESIRNVEGVSGVTSLRLAESLINGKDLQIIGIDPTTYPQIAGLDFTSGNEQRIYSDLAASRSVIINGILSSTYNIHVGDAVTLKTTHGDEIYQVTGIGMDYLDAKIATAYISQANLKADFNVDTDVLILVNSKADADKTRVVNSLQTLAANYPAFTLLNAATFKKSQQDLFSTAVGSLYLLAILLAIPGLIAMINTMSINVIERTREIGMLRAVGATRKQVRHMILIESLLLSTLGTLTGIAVGLFFSDFIIKVLNATAFSLDFYFPTTGIIVAVVIGILFGVLASIAPAQRAASTQIVESLRYE